MRRGAGAAQPRSPRTKLETTPPQTTQQGDVRSQTPLDPTATATENPPLGPLRSHVTRSSPSLFELLAQAAAAPLWGRRRLSPS